MVKGRDDDKRVGEKRRAWRDGKWWRSRRGEEGRYERGAWNEAGMVRSENGAEVMSRK